MKEKLYAFFKIIRPVNFFITFISVLVAATICLGGAFPQTNVFLAAISAALTLAAGNILNDIFDLETDKINHPQRPLPSGTINIKQSYILYFALLIFSLFISSFISMPVLLIVFSSNLLLILYTILLKNIPLAGNIGVAFLTGLVFIFGGVVVENPSAAVVPAIFAFLINLIREIVKDMQDVEGDKQAGLLTFPIKFGFLRSKLIIAFFAFALITFTFFPFITQYYKIEFFVMVMVSINPIMIYIVKKIYEKDFVKSLKKISILLKLSMILGLIAIYIGV